MFAGSFETEEREFRNRKTAISAIVTAMIMAVVLLIMFFIVLRTPVPPFEETGGGMSVNFGFDAEAAGDEQAYTDNPGPSSSSEEASQPTPSESNPDQMLSQENEEDAVAAPEAKEPVKPTTEKKPVVVKTPVKPTNNTTKTNNTTTTKTNTDPKPQVDKDALFSPGAPGSPKTGSDGTGTGKGDQGNPNGNPESKNYEGEPGPGTGGTPGPGYSLTGRGKVALPYPAKCSSQGKIVISIKVNRQGKVVDAVFKLLGSNTSDECNVNNALAAARKATFTPDADAPEIQEGTITYIYKVK